MLWNRKRKAGQHASSVAILTNMSVELDYSLKFLNGNDLSNFILWFGVGKVLFASQELKNPGLEKAATRSETLLRRASESRNTSGGDTCMWRWNVGKGRVRKHC